MKAQLVAFAQSARFDRWLTPLLLGAAGDAVVLLNLVDDMEYRTYSNVGRSQRTCPMVFGMEDSAQMPPLLEPLFHAGSEIGLQPVMNLDDLRVGLGDMKR